MPAAAPLDWAHGDPLLLRSAYTTLRPGRLRPGDRWHLVAGAPPVKVLVHQPQHRRQEGLKLLYFHGGGWFVGSPLSHADISRGLCHVSGLETWSVDYRLVPGHASSAPVRDGCTVARRLLARDRTLHLVLAGDSAGAAVALAVAQAMRVFERRHLLGILAFYGGYGLTESPTITAHGRREEGLDRTSLEAIYHRLADRNGAHPFTVANLSRHRLPPVALFVGDRDPLLTDSILLHEALTAKAFPSALNVVPNAGHSYLHGALEDDLSRWTLRQSAKLISRWCKGERPHRVRCGSNRKLERECPRSACWF